MSAGCGSPVLYEHRCKQVLSNTLFAAMATRAVVMVIRPFACMAYWLIESTKPSRFQSDDGDSWEGPDGWGVPVEEEPDDSRS